MPAVKLGIDCLLKNPPKWIKGARIGLLANQASANAQFEHSSTLLAQKFPGQLKALFSPQHGFYGEKQDNMIESDHSRHPLLKVPVFSLYAESRKPREEMFESIDVLIVDLPDVGTRVYTFIYTLAYCMEAAGKWGKKVAVLDRPNPVNGISVEGNSLKKGCDSFVGLFPIPMRHGLTIAEIARTWRGAFGVECDLEVIPMTGWDRRMFWEDTGLPWIMPSPNLPAFDSAAVYPGQVIWEGTNISEGRGTTKPFEIFGAPFINPRELKENIKKRKLEGFILRDIFFQPAFHKWSDSVCGGFQIHITDIRKYRPYFTSLCILQDILSLYRDEFTWKQPPYEYEFERLPIDLILGDGGLRISIENGEDLNEIADSWNDTLKAFEEMRREYLLY